MAITYSILMGSIILILMMISFLSSINIVLVCPLMALLVNMLLVVIFFPAKLVLSLSMLLCDILNASGIGLRSVQNEC